MRKLQLLVVAAMALLLGACASSPQRIVMNSLNTIAAGAQSSMHAIGTLYIQDRSFDAAGNVTSVNTKTPLVSEANKAAAEALYNKIQVSCKAVAATLETATAANAASLTQPIQDLADQLAAMLLTFQHGGGT
ncbi:MAG: hypothetical protein ABR961_03450 [Thermoanaerobaculaceae bacterium]|jgi:hypothetical protein